MAKRKIFVRTDLSTPKVEHDRVDDRVVVTSISLPPEQTIVLFPPNPTGIRKFDFAPWYGVRVDEVTYSVQRQIERFVDRQDSELEPSTIAIYAGRNSKFLEYLTLRATALDRTLYLADINRDVIDGFLGFLRDGGTSSTDQRVNYAQVKSVLKALGKRSLIALVPKGDDRTFPANPFPGSARKSKGEVPLSKAQRNAFALAVKTATLPLFSENVEVTGSLLVYALLVVALHTGRNTTPLLEMTPHCLRPHPREDKLFLVLWKRRGHSISKVVIRGESDQERAVDSLPTIGGNVATLVRRVIALSDEIRKQAPAHLQDRVWIFKAPAQSRTIPAGTVTELSASTISRAIAQLVEDFELVDSDGKPMRINISRLRKTFVNRMYEILDGDILATANAAGHSPRVAQTHYLRAGEDAEKNWRFMGIALVSELLTNTLGKTERTPVGNCTDVRNGEYAPKKDGKVCMSFLNCIRCRNYVVTGDDLYKLFSFYWRLFRERSKMDPRKWKRQFSHIIRLIDQDVVARGLANGIFKADQVEECRERARLTPHPFWRGDTIISSIEELAQ